MLTHTPPRHLARLARHACLVLGMLSTALAVVGIEAPMPIDVRELLQESELAQAQLNTLLGAQAAQIAQLVQQSRGRPAALFLR